VGKVLDKVTLEQAFIPVLHFPPIIIIPSVLYTHIHSSTISTMQSLTFRALLSRTNFSVHVLFLDMVQLKILNVRKSQEKSNRNILIFKTW
jgi:hypothetical protein